MVITIDGETLEVYDVRDYGYLPLVQTEGKHEYYVAPNSEYAGKQAREYWQDMADGDPTEFATLVGIETLVAWSQDRLAGPGTEKVRHLNSWLDLWLDVPEEQWSAYDGEEREVSFVSRELMDELDFVPEVAYRLN